MAQQERSADGIVRLEARLAAAERRIAELERVAIAGDADRVLLLDEVAAQIRRAPSTVSRWLKSPSKRAELFLDTLFRKDVSGRWTSTPRLLAGWQRAIAVKWAAPGRKPRAAVRN